MGTVCHQRLFLGIHFIHGFGKCLPAWARRTCSSALRFISKALQGNWCHFSFRWAGVLFYARLFSFHSFFFFFFTKCTLTFQCAATLGEERMQASLLGDNGETYHWKAQKPLVKSAACLCECECNSCAAVHSYSTFVFPSSVA